jgi:SP family sugar:H+ symporter-like MFS transporter
MLAIGQVLGAVVGLACHSRGDTGCVTTPVYWEVRRGSWRIPIAINLLWVVLLAGALLVVPESRE